MRRHLRNCCAASVLLVLSFGAAAWAQKPGGILKLYSWDSPPSVSILDGPNPIGQRTMAGVFNNLVMFDQHVKQNSLGSIVADLATGWSWGEDGKELTFKLRSGVKWHDGKPFIAKDVVCTWDLLLEKSSDRLRGNPLKYWYTNLEQVTANSDFEVTFHLKRPQPAFLTLLADGFSVIYPCHVAAAQMRQHPIGTAPLNLSSSNPTNTSNGRATRITGNPVCRISTGSSSRSSRTCRRRHWRLLSASST